MAPRHPGIRVDRRRLTALLGWLLPGLALVAMLVVALLFASEAQAERTRLLSAAPYLLAGVVLAAVGLGVVVAARLWRLWRERARRVPGARLRWRLLVALLALALPPLILLYGFSLRFLTVGIDSWFDVRVAEAMRDARALGQLYLADAESRYDQQTRTLAAELSLLPPERRGEALEPALDRLQALRLSVFGARGEVQAHVSADVRLALPEGPDSAQRARLTQQESLYEPLPLGDGLAVRVLGRLDGGAVLDAVYALPEAAAPLTRRVEQSLNDYARLSYLRGAVRSSFVLVLTLVAVIAALVAFGLADALTRRTVAPVTALATASGEIADGRLGAQVPAGGDDELGFLAEAFNRMSRGLAEADSRVRASQAEVERERGYLETVLSRLSSGVIGFDADGTIRTWNAAAAGLLGVAPGQVIGRTLSQLAEHEPALADLARHCAARAGEGAPEWREELRIARAQGEPAAPLVALVRGARLASGGSQDPGFVVVFDDAGQLNQANRDAAWSEVARRLAHEVKNPLTPIQLAAERLERRLATKLGPEDRELLERLSRTIVAQVDTLKQLVNAFGDYARPPRLALVPLDLNRLVAETLDLYEDGERVRVQRQLAADLPPIRADGVRLRQLLHNLIKNTQEAVGDGGVVELQVGTRRDAEGNALVLEFADNGPGLPAGFDETWFEPYTTTKPRGTGLGLAIVKKVAEEHGGSVSARNRPDGGAQFRIRLALS